MPAPRIRGLYWSESAYEPWWVLSQLSVHPEHTWSVVQFGSTPLKDPNLLSCSEECCTTCPIACTRVTNCTMTLFFWFRTLAPEIERRILHQHSKPVYSVSYAVLSPNVNRSVELNLMSGDSDFMWDTTYNVMVHQPRPRVISDESQNKPACSGSIATSLRGGLLNCSCDTPWKDPDPEPSMWKPCPWRCIDEEFRHLWGGGTTAASTATNGILNDPEPSLLKTQVGISAIWYHEHEYENVLLWHVPLS
jgi:hypothetical protein